MRSPLAEREAYAQPVTSTGAPGPARATGLPELTEYAAYIALAPVLGVEEAVERIEAMRDGGQPAAARVAADAAG